MAFQPSTLTHIEGSILSERVYYFHNVLAMDSGDTIYVQFKTPTDKAIHLYWKIWSDTGSFETWFYEGATEQTDGSAQTPLNAHRDSSETASSVLRSGVSAPSSTGTELFHTYSGKAGTGGWSGSPSEGGVSDGYSVVLAKDTNYIRKFVSNDDGNKINILAIWIEEED